MEEILKLNDKMTDQIIEEFYENRKIILNYNITEDCVESVLAYLMKWEMEDMGKAKEDRKPITIYCNSGGGYVDVGLTLIDFIQNMDTPVRMVVLSNAYSMMGLVILAVPRERRFAFKNSSILIHDGSTGAYTSTSKMKDIMRFQDETEERIKSLILDNTDISAELFEKKYACEWFLYAQEAKEHGIIGNIIGEDVKLRDIL